LQKCYQLIGLVTSLVGLYLLLANIHKSQFLYTQVVHGATISAYFLPDLSDRFLNIIFSFGVLLVGMLGIHTDIYRPQRERAVIAGEINS